jgi:hypothetical protein
MIRRRSRSESVPRRPGPPILCSIAPSGGFPPEDNASMDPLMSDELDTIASELGGATCISRNHL